MSRLRLTGLVVGAVWGVFAAGCGPRKKIAECQAVVAVVNEAVEAVRATTTASPEAGRSASDLRGLADALDAVRGRAENVNVSIAELTRLSQRHQAWLSQLSGAAREFAAAVEAVDVERTGTLEARLEELASQEDPFVDELNAFCHAP